MARADDEPRPNARPEGKVCWATPVRVAARRRSEGEPADTQNGSYARAYPFQPSD